MEILMTERYYEVYSCMWEIPSGSVGNINTIGIFH